MDTWATSSLTPHIACGWETDDDLFRRTFPMDLCTQAHDIIRTWLFSRVVRAHYENGVAPWSHALISGFIMDPDRKKMSKSKGNAVVPDDVLDKYGADAVRWRAAMARPGLDSPFDEAQMKVGRRLAMKVLNASQFVLGGVGATVPDPGAVTEPVDRALLARLAEVVEGRPSLRRVRLHDRTRDHREVLLGVLRRLPRAGQGACVRRPGRLGDRLGQGRPRDCTARPAPAARAVPSLRHRRGLVVVAGGLGPPRALAAPREIPDAASGDAAVLDAVAAALAGIRGAKSQAKVSMRAELSRVEIAGPAAAVAAAEAAAEDLRKVGKVTGDLVFTARRCNEISIAAELTADPRLTGLLHLDRGHVPRVGARSVGRRPCPAGRARGPFRDPCRDPCRARSRDPCRAQHWSVALSRSPCSRTHPGARTRGAGSPRSSPSGPPRRGRPHDPVGSGPRPAPNPRRTLRPRPSSEVAAAGGLACSVRSRRAPGGPALASAVPGRCEVGEVGGSATLGERLRADFGPRSARLGEVGEVGETVARRPGARRAR